MQAALPGATGDHGRQIKSPTSCAAADPDRIPWFSDGGKDYTC